MSEKPHILVAVDNLQSARPLRVLLENAGYSTEWHPLNQAATHAMLRKPDLWIFDTLLMDDEETETFRAIRRREGWEDVPVLTIATVIDGDSLRRIRLLAADEVIAKPIDSAELMIKIKSLLRQRSIEAQARGNVRNHATETLEINDPIANLRRIVATQSSGQNLETILVQLLKYVRRLAGYDEAFICAESEPRKYSVVAYVGEGTANLPTFYEPGQSYTGWLVLHKKPLLVRDIETETRAKIWGRTRGQNDSQNSFAGLPLLHNNHVIGTIELVSRARNAYDRSVFERIRPVAEVAALAIEHSSFCGDTAFQPDISTPEPFRIRRNAEIVFHGPALEPIVKAAHRVKDSQCSVLITGETGTGKELIARYIHGEGNRKQLPFVDLNCAAVPESLQETELFGIEKGIATGVDRHIGKFEATGDGVLFLDEVAYMPAAMQAKMLRVLQERAFERVGGNKKQEFRGRVIAATSRDMAQAIKDQSFREELYYRLAVVHLHLPPLRERREDIPYLVRHFVHLLCVELGRLPLTVSPAAMSAFVDRDWPGNVRELRNAVERSILFSDETDLMPENAGIPARGTASRASEIMNMAFQEQMTVPELVNRYTRYVYERMGHNKARTCDYLQINYRTLQRRLADDPQEAVS